MEMYKRLKAAYHKIFKEQRKYKIDYKYLRGCKKILDIGSGKGYFIENNPVAITGIDYNEKSIGESLSKGHKVIKASALHLPFKDAAFDGIHCAHLIEHFELDDVKKIISEIYRVLKPSGILVLRTPMYNKYFFNDPTHIRPYPPSAIMNLLGLIDYGQSSLVENLKITFRFVKLKIFRGNLFQPIYEVSVAPRQFPCAVIFKSIGLLLAQFNIKSFGYSDYLIVLSKCVTK